MTVDHLLLALSEPTAWLARGDVEVNDAWLSLQLPTAAVEVDAFVDHHHPTPRRVETQWGLLEVAAWGGGWLLRLVRPNDSRSLLEGAEYRALFDVATDGVFIYDDDRALVDVNAAACRMHGWSREQMLQMQPSEFIHHSTHHVFRDFITTLQTEPVFHGYARGNRADGSTFDVEVHGVPILIRGMRHYVSSIRDITDRLRLQEEVSQAHRLDSLSRLAGSIAHDFNNLLTIVLSSVSIAQEELADDASVAELLRDASQATLRARHLTERLLTFAHDRVTSAHTIELGSAIDKLLPDLRAGLPDAVEIEFESPTAATTVNLPVDDLEEVMTHLLSNAALAMPEGGTVRVMVEHRGEPATQVGITVRDHGIGMNAEQAAQAFEPYFTTRADQEGHGLGLAIVHGIVHQHGGSVKLLSLPGAGTSVQIWWPCAAMPTLTPPPPPSLPPSTTPRVLVVEDEPAVRRVLQRMLSHAGYDVVAVSGVSEASEHMRAATVELLLTDLRLLDGTGIELTEVFRREQPGHAIMWISGQAPQATERPDDVVFLEKPFAKAELLSAVRAALDLSEHAS